jgi:hypothetical protein
MKKEGWGKSTRSLGEIHRSLTVPKEPFSPKKDKISKREASQTRSGGPLLEFLTDKVVELIVSFLF